MKKWGEKGDEEINNQIMAFQICSNQITNTEIYKLEVHRNRNKELELQTKVLEKKVEEYREQHSMFKVMMHDFEVYKQKALQSKELATFFSPFTPINQFSQEELMSQPIKRDKVLDMSNVIKSEGAKKIKELEQELEEMREHKKKKDKLETDLIN